MIQKCATASDGGATTAAPIVPDVRTTTLGSGPAPVRVGNALDLDGYPVSAAVVVGDRIETAGVIPTDPATGELVSGDIVTQTERVLDNLELILAAAGTDLDGLVFVDVVLADVERDFADFSASYAERIGPPHPARRTIGGRLALPGMLVELRATAHRTVGARDDRA